GPLGVPVLLEGPAANLSSLQAVQDWLRKERLAGLAVERKSSLPPEHAMGGGIETALAAIAKSAKTVLGVLKSLHTYLTATRPKLKIVMVVGDSRVELDGQNLTDLQPITDHVRTVLRELHKGQGQKQQPGK